MGERSAASRPRPAATVVVTRARGRGEAHEIFMVRRSSRSAFMPNALVFPGGKVDPEDGPPGSDAAFERAARRECLEESGIDLGACPLRWFDTWVTPSAEKRRYEARFFLTEIAAGEGRGAAADGHETHDGRWAPAAALLEFAAASPLFLAPPTLILLQRLADPGWIKRLEADDAYHPEQLLVPILPKWIRGPAGLEGETTDIVVLPHDPEYPALTGEGAPAPARSSGMPHRLVRVGLTWRAS